MLYCRSDSRLATLVARCTWVTVHLTIVWWLGIVAETDLSQSARALASSIPSLGCIHRQGHPSPSILLLCLASYSENGSLIIERLSDFATSGAFSSLDITKFIYLAIRSLGPCSSGWSQVGGGSEEGQIQHAHGSPLPAALFGVALLLNAALYITLSRSNPGFVEAPQRGSLQLSQGGVTWGGVGSGSNGRKQCEGPVCSASQCGL